MSSLGLQSQKQKCWNTGEWQVLGKSRGIVGGARRKTGAVKKLGEVQRLTPCRAHPVPSYLWLAPAPFRGPPLSKHFHYPSPDIAQLHISCCPDRSLTAISLASSMLTYHPVPLPSTCCFALQPGRKRNCLAQDWQKYQNAILAPPQKNCWNGIQEHSGMTWVLGVTTGLS